MRFCVHLICSCTIENLILHTLFKVPNQVARRAFCVKLSHGMNRLCKGPPLASLILPPLVLPNHSFISLALPQQSAERTKKACTKPRSLLGMQQNFRKLESYAPASGVYHVTSTKICAYSGVGKDSKGRDFFIAITQQTII